MSRTSGLWTSPTCDPPEASSQGKLPQLYLTTQKPPDLALRIFHSCVHIFLQMTCAVSPSHDDILV